MTVWKNEEQNEAPLAEWFASLLQRSGFEPEHLWMENSTLRAQTCGFVFRLERTYIEAIGSVPLGARIALLKRNAHRLTDLYDDGLMIVFKSAEAIQAFRDMLNQSDTLAKAVRKKTKKAYAQNKQKSRRKHSQVRELP